MATVKLVDVIRRANTKVDKDNTDLIYYVGGEHVESENIRVRNKGLIAGSTIGPMFYYGFKKGDFLLVSRNPHLKKAGLVDLDGICSEKTFVLETLDTSVLLPAFLPFVLQNDRFWTYAFHHRHGSTNTFINWSTLATYEFELPSLDTQQKLADVLWSVNDTIEAYKRLLSATDELVKSQFIEMFGLPEDNIHRFETGKISDIVKDVHYGTSKKASDDGEYIYIRMNNITYEGMLDLTDYKRISVPEKELKGCIVEKGDVLFNRTNSRDLVGKTCTFNLNKPMLIAGYIIRLRMNGRVHPDYLTTFLNLKRSKDLLFAMAKGAVGQANINAQEVQSIDILIPPEDLQKKFDNIVHQSDKSKFVKYILRRRE